MNGIRYATTDQINGDARIIGISVSGLWLVTSRFPRLKMAWALVCLAWQVLQADGIASGHDLSERVRFADDE